MGNAASPDGRVPALDGVRGLACLLVFTAHYFYTAPQSDAGWDRVLVRTSAIGGAGVDVFFVLSGFLITGILIDTRHQSGGVRTFYIRRALRIFPLYYATLAVCAVAAAAAGRFDGDYMRASWWYWVYLQNVATTFTDVPPIGLTHFWSLAVEEHFYLAWPWVVRATSDRRLGALCLGMVVAATGLRAGFLAVGLPYYEFTLTRMDSLALGGALAVLVRQDDLYRRVVRYVPVAVAGVLIAGVALQQVLSGTRLPVVQVFKHNLYAGVAALLVLAAVQPGGAVRWVLSTRWLCRCGAVSYGMYVFHPFIHHADWATGWQHRLAAGGSPWAGPIKLLMFVVLLALTYALAELSFRLFERPITGLKRYFEYRTERPAAPVPVPALPDREPAVR